MKFIVGLIVGLFIGWQCGTWSENRRWLDALCGRERIWRSRTEKESQ